MILEEVLRKADALGMEAQARALMRCLAKGRHGLHEASGVELPLLPTLSGNTAGHYCPRCHTAFSPDGRIVRLKRPDSLGH